MRTSKFALGVLTVALIVGVGASALWAGHVSSGSPSLESKTYQPGWANVPWLEDTMPIGAALSPIADSVGAVYYLDPDGGGWQSYFPGKAEAGNLTTMTFGQSYLMLFTKPVTLELVTQPEDICDPGECSPCPTTTRCPVDTQTKADLATCQSSLQACDAERQDALYWVDEWTELAQTCLSDWESDAESRECRYRCLQDLGNCQEPAWTCVLGCPAP